MVSRDGKGVWMDCTHKCALHQNQVERARVASKHFKPTELQSIFHVNWLFWY